MRHRCQGWAPVATNLSVPGAHFEHLELNQLSMVRTIFEEQMVNVLEQNFKPFPGVVKKWLNQTDFS
jgi:hypothetical protein